MNQPLSPQDQDIHAYVDGELSPEGRRRVEMRLAGDPALRHRLADDQRIREALRTLYEPVLAEPVPARLLRWPAHESRPTRLPVAIAGGLALVLGGMLGGWYGHELRHLQEEAEEYLVQDAVSAYVVYTPEVRHTVEVNAAQQPHLGAWLSRRLAIPVRIADLGEFGFNLLGGRLLASEEGPGALIMYEMENGGRLIFYQCRNNRDEMATALRFEHRGKVAVYYWFDGQSSLAIAGETDRDNLQAIAEAVYRQTTTAPAGEAAAPRS